MCELVSLSVLQLSPQDFRLQTVDYRDDFVQNIKAKSVLVLKYKLLNFTVDDFPFVTELNATQTSRNIFACKFCYAICLNKIVPPFSWFSDFSEIRILGYCNLCKHHKTLGTCRVVSQCYSEWSRAFPSKWIGLTWPCPKSQYSVTQLQLWAHDGQESLLFSSDSAKWNLFVLKLHKMYLTDEIFVFYE